MKNIALLPLLITVAVGITACSGTQQVVKDEIDGKPVIEVSEERTRTLVAAIKKEASDQERTKELGELVRATSQVDPVVFNAKAMALLTEGDHSHALVMIRQAAEELSDTSQWLIHSADIPEKLAIPEQKTTNSTATNPDDQKLLEALREVILYDDKDALAYALREWKRNGSFTYPPTFPESGMIGLTLETISQSRGDKLFQPYMISYHNRHGDMEAQQWRQLDTVAANFIMAGILALDQEAIIEGINYSENIPNTHRSHRTRQIRSIGEDLINENL